MRRPHGRARPTGDQKPVCHVQFLQLAAVAAQQADRPGCRKHYGSAGTHAEQQDQ